MEDRIHSRQYEDVIEEAKEIHHRDDGIEKEERPQMRYDNIPDLLPASSTIDSGCIHQVFRQGLHSGKEDHHRKWSGTPDRVNDDQCLHIKFVKYKGVSCEQPQ